MTIQEAVNPTFAFSILDSIPDAIIWVCPHFDTEGTIEDFDVLYSNKSADEAIQHPKGSLTGLRIRRDGIPSRESAESNFRHFLEVYQSGEPKDYSFFAHHSGRSFETYRRMHEGGVLSITRDRKEQREAERKEQEKTQLLTGIMNNAPAGIEVYEAIRNEAGDIVDFRTKLYNQFLHQLTGVTEEERSRLHPKALLQLLDAEDLFDRYVHTVETGEPFSLEYFARRIQKWLQLSVVRLGDGFLIILSDITQLKAAELNQQKQSLYLRRIQDASLHAVMTLEAIRDSTGAIIDLRYTQINSMYRQMIGKTEADVIGRTMLELFPTAKPTGAFDTHCQVIETGIPARFDIRYQGEGLDAWYDVSSVKVGDNGVVVTFADVLEQKKAAAEIEQQKNLLDNILKYSSNGISVGEVVRDGTGKVVDARTILANDAAVKFTGLSKEIYLTKKATEIDPNITASLYFQMCLNTLETGEPFITQYLLEATGRWLEVSVSKMDEDHLIYIFTDVSSIKEAQLKVERSAVQLQTIINRTQSGIFTLSPVKDEGDKITDFRFMVVNRALAAYVNQEPDALMGQLGSKWFSGYKQNGLFDLFCNTFETGTMNRFDFHYNADGIDAWIDIMCTQFDRELLVTFTDYTPVKKLQLELQKTVEELKQSNESLEEFAYAASHDLQEPLRKIHTFSDRLRHELSAQLNSVQQMMFERIESATQRMRNLIDDLLDYSQVSRRQTELEQIDLNTIMKAALHDLEAGIAESGALIRADNLPVIKGDERQMRQLLQNLIGNAVKYRKLGISPQVKITCNKVQGKDTGIAALAKQEDNDFYEIKVSDNGIGFQQEYADSIFQVFHRLHSRSEYEGTGIGLAIVQRVVQNHNGYITAEGEPGVGATFRVLLPV